MTREDYIYIYDCLTRRLTSLYLDGQSDSDSYKNCHRIQALIIDKLGDKSKELVDSIEQELEVASG